MERQLSDTLRTLLGVVLSVGLSFLALRLALPRPFIWIWLAALLLCGVLAVRVHTEWLRRLWLAGLGVAIALLLLEVGFVALEVFRSDGIVGSGSYVSGGYAVSGGELGYAPKPGIRVTSKKTLGQRVLYDVVYTISDEGVRVTKASPGGDTWLFTGDSYTFGEGLNDDETLPSRFSAELGYRANVVNLGFHGYGPHQMVRSLEKDLVHPLIHAPVKQVIYQGFWEHAVRAAGGVSWDVQGPSYSLTEKSVTYDGPFHRRPAAFVLKVLRKSALFSFVLDATLFRANMSDEDVERYARILERSAQLAREKYTAGFTVVFWDEDNEPSRRVLARLRRTTLPLVIVSEIIPRKDWSAVLIPLDHHPNAEANRRLAKALAERLVLVEPSQPVVQKP